MFLPGWSICCVLLALRMSAFGLEISLCENDEVVCSQGLSDCTMKGEMGLTMAGNNGVDVQNLTPYFKLCCSDKACSLCLVIDTEINIHPDKDTEDEGHSGLYEEDYPEETKRNPKASVTVCYIAPPINVPTCKKVEFTVNHTALTQPNQAKFSMVIIKPAGISFSSHVTVYSSKPSNLSRSISAPCLNEVCSEELQGRVAECSVPSLSSVINQKMNQVELQFDGSNENHLTVCVRYEKNGICQKLNRMIIPLYSVTPCMCLQAWDKENWSSRSQSCPFINNTDFLQRNVWQNVSVSVGQGQMNNDNTMLVWNISAPCRLTGEVWPCKKENSCREINGFRQQLANGTWKQNSMGQWEQKGLFEDINLQLSPCVMVKVEGMRDKLGPFCYQNTDRWRWSLLVVGLMLLVCLTVLIVYHLHGFVKECVRSCRHGGFVNISRKGHVVLLSPPDVDAGVSDSVCHLDSELRHLGFSVCVDQWSTMEQCSLGPLPWLHSQLLKLESQGGRIVLVLTRKALERTEEWTHRNKEVIRVKEEDKGLPQTCSPYSDVFTASLSHIQADKQLGRAGERFLLVTFDSHPRSLPKVLQGLPLFHLPSHTQALLSELTVGGTRRGSGRRTWTGWKWRASDGWRAKTKEGTDHQRASNCKYVGV